MTGVCLGWSIHVVLWCHLVTSTMQIKDGSHVVIWTRKKRTISMKLVVCNYFVLCLTFFSSINSFNSYLQLGNVRHLVHGLNNKIFFFLIRVRRWGSASLGSSFEVWYHLRRSTCLVIMSSSPAGTCSSWDMCRPVGMWCDASLNRNVRWIFASLWRSA